MKFNNNFITSTGAFLMFLLFFSCGKEEKTTQANNLSSKDDIKDLAQFVDPMIGTAKMGHTYPGATVPFGSVQLSPDTDTIPYAV